MKKRYINSPLDEMALNAISNVAGSIAGLEPDIPVHAWIKILRTALRMTQRELAHRAKISQAHLTAIETGKIDPQLSTISKIFSALTAKTIVKPLLQKPISEILKARADVIALRRLKRGMGTMALENQAPDSDVFRHLLDKERDEILNDTRVHLWREENE
jgi:transcriptional regulator with XRE-family HTH domain